MPARTASCAVLQRRSCEIRDLLLVAERARVVGDEGSRGIDQERFRDPGGAELARVVAISVAELRVGDPELADELAPVLGQVAGVDPQHGQPGAVPTVEALERRRLLAARPAPGRPDVDQHPAAPVVGERAAAVARELPQLGLRHRIAHLEAVAALGGEPEAEEADHGEHRCEDDEGACAHRFKGRLRSMEAAERERLTTDYVGAWNAHDPDAVAAFFAPAAVYDDRGASELVSGREAIRAHAAAVKAALPD